MTESTESPVRLYTPKEVGVLLRVHEATVRRRIALGLIRSIDISMPGSASRMTRIREDDLAAYLDQLRHEQRAAAQ